MNQPKAALLGEPAVAHSANGRSFVSFLAGLLMALAMLAPCSSSMAQDRGGDRSVESTTDEGAEGAPEDPAVKQGLFHYGNLFTLIKDGGVMLLPLVVCSFLMLVFVFERTISLRRGHVIPAPFVKKFFHQIREGKLDRDQALEMCQENPCPVAFVFAGAVKKWGRPSVEVEQAILDAGERAANTLRKYLRLFNAIATISPLMGLLGTVFGMIRLFNEISRADAMGRTEALAGGISEALLTTAGGLIVAIPAMCFYLIFQSRVDKLTMEIDSLGQDLVGLISAEALQEDRQNKTRANRRPTAA